MSIEPLPTSPTVPTPISPMPSPQQLAPPTYVPIITQLDDDSSGTDTPQNKPNEYNIRSHAHKVANLVIHMVPFPIKNMRRITKAYTRVCRGKLRNADGWHCCHQPRSFICCSHRQQKNRQIARIPTAHQDKTLCQHLDKKIANKLGRLAQGI